MAKLQYIRDSSPEFKMRLLLAIVGIFTVAYTIGIFATYPIARGFGVDDQKYRDNRNKHNYEHPANLQNNAVLSISFNGPYEWNNPLLEEYSVFGVGSEQLNLTSLSAEQAANSTLDDETCELNRVAAKIKWRGRTKPPLKPSFKIKLYRCECDPQCEWKKFKLSQSTAPELGYTGNATNKWTLRSDRLDILNLYDQYATDLFEYLGGRDSMWSRPAMLKINNEEMGLFQFITSPSDDLLPFKDDDLSLLFENDGFVFHSLTQSEVDIKEPDVDDWCSVNNVTGCEDRSLTSAQRQDVTDFLIGNSTFDYQTLAARYWAHEVTQNCDYK